MGAGWLDWILGNNRKRKALEKSVEPAAASLPPQRPEPPSPSKPPTVPAQRPKGHAEAARRIMAWVNKPPKAKARAKEVDLSGLGLSNLPEEIGQLAELKRLNLSNNALSDDALQPLSGLQQLEILRLRRNKIAGGGLAALSELPALSSLDLGFNQIGENTSVLARLQKLATLFLDSNQITSSGARPLAGMVNLTSLSMANNKIGDDGAQAVANLINLKTLNLSNNQIGAAGAQELARLTALKNLYLNHNKIGSDGAAAFSVLSALKTLDLSHTGVSDLSFLSAIRGLKTLGLNGLQLRTEDAEFLRRTGLQVYLSKGKLGDIPVELLSKHPTDDCMRRLRMHLKARDEDETNVEVRDVKVMILGNGRVGKTQLRRRLANLPYDETVESTHGVEIISINLPPASDAPTGTPPTPLKVWDFGGQDIYLGTHALFLKTRAVFPILWTPVSEANETHEVDGQPYRNYPLNEWVRYVLQLAGEKSPVLLVQSRCESPVDRAQPPVDPALLKRFTMTPQAIFYSAQMDQPQDRLLTPLRDAISAMAAASISRISARWARVKLAIERRAADGIKRMTRAEFNELCTKEKVTDPEAQAVLLGMLHDFGTVFHDKSVWDDLIVLDQNWALQNIYAMFDRKSGAHETLHLVNKGRFTRSDLGSLLWDKDHSPRDQAAFIAMMVSCKAAFLLRPESEIHGEALYIAPDLLPDRSSVEPLLVGRYEEAHADAAREFSFAFALPSMLRELMGRWGEKAGQDGIYWQEGLWFHDKRAKSNVIVEALRPGDRSWRATIRIRAWHGDAAAVLDRLSHEVAEVAADFGAEPEGSTDILTDLASRSDLQEPEGQEASAVEPAEQPDSSEGEAARRCFITYAWGGDSDEAARARLRAFEAVEARLRSLGIEPHIDKQQLRHGESISAFMRSAARLEKFVVIISKKYLESPYCMDELLRIWRNCKSDQAEFRARVRAVVLDDARIATMSERFEVSQFWAARRDEASQIVQQCVAKRLAVPPDVSDTHNVANDLTIHVATILAQINDGFPIRSVDQIDQLDF